MTKKECREFIWGYLRRPEKKWPAWQASFDRAFALALISITYWVNQGAGITLVFTLVLIFCAIYFFFTKGR